MLWLAGRWLSAQSDNFHFPGSNFVLPSCRLCYGDVLAGSGLKNMGQVCRLEATEWAAILPGARGEAATIRGAAAEESSIPAGLRRRMGRLERLSIRCALGVLGDPAEGELVFCSRHGNLDTLSALLQALANRELLSPMGFSGSVHNATPGLIGQVTRQRLSHTALSAGMNTLHAGLVESFARLHLDKSARVTLIYCDLDFPAFFAAFDEERADGVALAIGLSSSVSGIRDRLHTVAPGRQGVIGLVHALQDGVKQIAMEWH